MGVTKNKEVPWLLLVFSLPARSASQRVQIWRKLQRYGMLALRSSGYVLPNTAANQERMEWLATAIRTYEGQASVVQVQGFDDLPADRLQRMFVEARSRDYQKLLHEVKKLLALSPSRRPGGRLNRIRRRFLDLQDIDFFENRLRTKLENLLAQADESGAQKTSGKAKRKSGEYVNRLWMTRPRPGIDRVSSAWLIRRFIDPKARFVFGAEPGAHPDAIPFDMFCPQGFERYGIGMGAGFSTEDEACLGVDEPADQPSRRNAINARTKPGHPQAVDVLAGLPFGPAAGLLRPRFIGLGKQVLKLRAQSIFEEVDILKVQKAAANPVQA